jgi:hypothetical protein
MRVHVALLCTFVVARVAAAEEALVDPTPGAEKAVAHDHETSDQATIRLLLERVAALEARVAELEGGTRRPETESAAAAERQVDQAAAAPGEPKPASQPPPELVASADEQNPLIRAAFQRTLIERGGLLLPPRTIDIDTSVRYLNSSTERVVIDGFTILPVLVVGDIVSERVRRELTETSATARIGLSHGLQVDIRVPVARQTQSVITADNKEETARESGLGDVEVALSRQLRHSGGRGPDVLGSLRWKTTTGANSLALDGGLVLGTGYDSLATSVTAVKVLDPAVLFGGLSYTYSLPTEAAAGKLQPGNSYGFNVGLAIALNLNTSLSFTYEQQFVHRSVLNESAILGSDLSTGVFSVGASVGLNDTRSLNFSMGVGVTEDSPDLLLNFSVPLRKRLRQR